MSSAPFFAGTSPNDDRSPSPVNPPRYLHDLLADWPRMSVPTHALNWRRPPPHRFGPFRAKTDGPNWAATRRNTPNPVRISSPHTSDRFIHSCFPHYRMTRQGLQSANEAPLERQCSLAWLPNHLHFQALTGQRVHQPVFVAESGANDAVWGVGGPRKSGKLYHFAAPRQHRGERATYRRYLFPPTGL